MTDREIFRKNFAELLRITKVKQIDIAKVTGINTRSLSAWACGRAYPRVDALEKLCDYFGVRMSALTEEQNPEKSNEDMILDSFRAMSPEGQEKLIERANEMKVLYPKRRKRNAKAEETI